MENKNIMKRYFDVILENNYSSIKRTYKLGGHLFEITIRDLIKNIVGNKYYVSGTKAFIKSCNKEFDILVLKKDVSNLEKSLNYYDLNNVVGAIEVKSGGICGNVDFFDNLLSNIDNNKVSKVLKDRYYYISLCERVKDLNFIGSRLGNRCFWFIRNYWRTKLHELVINHNALDSEVQKFENKIKEWF